MATIEDLAELKNENIRKALRGFIAVASTDVPAITSITQGVASELKPLTVGWSRLGNISKQSGLSFKRETDNAEVESWGQAEPTRVDMTKDVTSVTFECQETRKPVLEEYYQVDLSAVSPDADSGEVNFAQPTTLRKRYRRYLFLAADGFGEDEIFIAKFMPRFSATQVADQAWNEADALTYGITGNAMVDSRIGYSIKHYFGGPGWKKQLRSAGFDSTYTVKITGTGNFRLVVGGVATADLADTSDALAITAALEALETVGIGGAEVQGTAGEFTIALVHGGDLKAITEGPVVDIS